MFLSIVVQRSAADRGAAEPPVCGLAEAPRARSRAASLRAAAHSAAPAAPPPPARAPPAPAAKARAVLPAAQPLFPPLAPTLSHLPTSLHTMRIRLQDMIEANNVIDLLHPVPRDIMFVHMLLRNYIVFSIMHIHQIILYSCYYYLIKDLCIITGSVVRYK